MAALFGRLKAATADPSDLSTGGQTMGAPLLPRVEDDEEAAAAEEEMAYRCGRASAGASLRSLSDCQLPSGHSNVSLADALRPLLRSNSLPVLYDPTQETPSSRQFKPVLGFMQGKKYTFVKDPEETFVQTLLSRPKIKVVLEEAQDDIAEAFRLLPRLDYLRASRQQHKLQIHRVHHLSHVYSLYLRDLFHTLVNMRLRFLFLLFGLCYLLAFTLLAAGFWWINDDCNLGMENFHEAFAFAVETWLTIGYGVNDPPGPYMKQCRSGVVLLTLQGIIGLFVNAFLVSLVITHVSSGAFRGCTMIFSEKALVREVEGRLYLMFQVCEMRSTQLLEAHVRAYVIRRPVSPMEVPVDGPQAFELRLLRPDDENGALMLPVLPTVIVHEIDACSPLAPMGADDPLRSRHWARPAVREADARNGSRDSVWCRTCGESFQFEEMLEAHQLYQAEQDELSGAKLRPHLPPAPRPSTPTGCAPEAALQQRASEYRKSVAGFLERDWFEILIILEGVDTMTASTVQARHSYIREDIVWDHTFAPMFSVDPYGGAVIDFTKVDDIVPAPPE
mmetsp:Transcript_82687/g.267705  ORF Transcript_82687/g.267705 Transcript_82687/m.267705 type:complete len:561 (+) Transcript_82687:201-1883(+)|eukprot:CAMPEP_0203891062 /NCGR_PEP_ID=MMETSP0359-20131031/34399_1 /ASSEMBLY_ACC=CAM_ASM_000338 /TAXON_ID=268821 /ORGANISM="Scrippsiella Hangoei, Strain SHTV-5" /LENGTH=560 /DNA_ID=CAMNT_0050812787 /DNA_START=182 /DNA_END=1864 /DNA_ORIENTATION=-